MGVLGNLTYIKDNFFSDKKYENLLVTAP